MDKKFYIKFTGKFKDLIPQGWKFQKLFARNYRHYSIYPSGEKYSQSLHIWQHLGGYLEIGNLYNDSYILLDFIIKNRNLLCDNLLPELKLEGAKNNGYYFLVLDKDRGIIEPKNYDIHNEMKYIDDKELLKKYYERYRDFILQETTLKFLLKMWIKNQIEIREDNRKIKK